METELLILKHADGYIRVMDSGYLACPLEKASVFPVSGRDDVENHLQNLRESGFVSPKIHRLIIREEPLE